MLRKLILLFLVAPLFAQTNTFIPGGSVNSQTNSYTATSSDVGKIIKMNCVGCVLTLPSTPPFPNWTIIAKNVNASPLTVSPNGLALDDSTGSVLVNQGQWLQITTDGNVYTSLASGGGTSQSTLSIALNSNALDFGTVQTNSGTSTQSFTISNNGTVAVSIVSIVLTGSSDFSNPTPSAGIGFLAAGASTPITLQFAPTASTTETATATVTSTAGINTIALSGTGQAGAAFNLTVTWSGSGSGSVQSGDGTSPCAIGQTCTPPSIICSMISVSANGDCGSSYPSGTVVVLTATPTTGNTFGGFTGGGCSISPCSVTVTSNLIVKASFTPISVSFVLNVIPNGQGTGLITSNIGGISCTGTAGVLTGTCSASFPQGTNVLLTETPSTSGHGTCVGADCTFTSWGGVNCPNSTCQVTISATTSVSTGFAAPTATAPTQLIQTINGGTPGTNNIAANFSNTQIAGDANILYVAWNDATTTISGVTDSSGNTYTLASCTGNPLAASGMSLALYYSTGIVAANAGANTVTVAMTASPSYRVIMASEYSGITTFDVCHGASGSGTALDSGSFTTTVGNDLLVGGDNVAHGISVPSSGWTQQIANSGNDVEDQKNVAAAAYHFLPTQAPTGTWQAIGAGFKTGGGTAQVRYSFNIVGSGTGTGTITGAGISCTITAGVPSGTCSTSVASGGTVTLTATPASGSNFGNYLGAGCSTSPNCVTQAITTNTSVTGTFSVPQSSGGPFTILNQPPVTNRPYPSAYFNKKLPNAGNGGPSGHQMPNSANIVSTVMKNGGSTLVTSSGFWNSPGTDDGQHRSFAYGQSTDPVYQISGCTGPSTSTSVNGQKLHAPSAFPYNQGSFDKEGAFWDQTTDMMFQFYGGTSTQLGLPACAPGATCNFVPNGGYCSAVNHTTGAGYDGGNAASTAGLAPMANIIRLTEIYQIGHINHGLRGVTTCVDTNNGTYPSKLVFPANVPSGAPANTCANAGVSATNRPPEGALFYLDYTQAQLDCFDPSKPGTVCGGVNKLIGWQFALIEATTFYGITMEDTGNGSSISLPGIESEQGYYFYDVNGFPGAKAQADAFTAYMNANCSGATCTVARRCTDANNAICANGHSQWQWGINAWANISLVGGLDIIGHMHVADPCVVIAQQGLANDGHGTNACP